MDQETFEKVKLKKIRISKVWYKYFCIFVVKIPKYRYMLYINTTQKCKMVKVYPTQNLLLHLVVKFYVKRI